MRRPPGRRVEKQRRKKVRRPALREVRWIHLVMEKLL